MPGIDADALMNAQQKNIEAISNANQLAAEGFQAIGKRQTELFQQAVEDQKALARCCHRVRRRTGSPNSRDCEDHDRAHCQQPA